MPKRSSLLWVPLLLAGTGCAYEPYEAPGTWQSRGVNEANLRAMVANPADLQRGQAPLTPTRGEAAAMAAARLGFPSAPGEDGTTVAGRGTAVQTGVSALPPPVGTNVRR
ncbi:hypothetical protein [Falsiroseomonas oryzae]|uniref:hypothetical protein n=1 Tax=Falsiroseomonas oryzae TaxID=2766473 RepID=UPI0022EA5E33|nr:hypothetical protein [Roseomonas sp. MO-31]